MTGTVVLDNEAVQALSDAGHPKHRRALSHVQVVAARKRKGRAVPALVVPTAVRVGAGWDRTDPEAAFINLLGLRDVPLDTRTADRAASILRGHRVSVADAHLGATVQSLPERSHPVTIISSDTGDMQAVCGATPVRVVRL